MPNLKLCILFPCFCPHGQATRESYKIYHQSHSAYAAYREQAAEWEKIYGTNSHKKENILERLKNPPKKTTEYQPKRTAKSKDRGAR